MPLINNLISSHPDDIKFPHYKTKQLFVLYPTLTEIFRLQNSLLTTALPNDSENAAWSYFKPELHPWGTQHLVSSHSSL